ncbi:hypothetical protein BD414DRAFT_499038 [Trametes punicea]|nr:hypothetical protein BD414DRAFT_499038 [Trametes punicea]
MTWTREDRMHTLTAGLGSRAFSASALASPRYPRWRRVQILYILDTFLSCMQSRLQSIALSRLSSVGIVSAVNERCFAQSIGVPHARFEETQLIHCCE